MSFGFKVEVWGDYACFTIPSTKSDRTSYEVMTPSAARNILQSIYWHPGMNYVIDKIYVMNPIKFISVKRNEIKCKASALLFKKAMLAKNPDLYCIDTINQKDIHQQVASRILKDVRYVIEAHFVMTKKASATDTPEKFYNIILRRIRNGQNFQNPYFGCREFPLHYQLYEKDTIETAYPNTDKDLNIMVFDNDYSDEKNILTGVFHAKLQKGVMDLRNAEVLYL